MSERLTVQKEALNALLKHKRAGLAISMGVGKTRIGLYHLNTIFTSNTKALVVIPKLSLKKSWLDEIDKTELHNLTPAIEFVTYLSLNKKNPADYTVIYLDECHNLLNSHSAFLRNFTGQIIGLTGTPPVNSFSEKYIMVDTYCPIVYSFSIDDATEQNILNDYKIIVHKLNLGTYRNHVKKNKNGGTWLTSEYDDYIYFSRRLENAATPKDRQMASIMRMRALMDYKTKERYVERLLDSINEKCIIFANTQEQADRIYPYSYHSQNPDSEENLRMFSEGSINKLSCVLQLSEGVTIPNLKEGIIMHAYGNERKTAQRIGRLLRLNPNDTATCHILCYKNTVDESWINKALESFDKNKIKWVE